MSDKLNLHTLLEVYADEIAKKVNERENGCISDKTCKQAKIIVTKAYLQACAHEISEHNARTNDERRKMQNPALIAGAIFGSVAGALLDFSLRSVVTGAVIGGFIAGGVIFKSMKDENAPEAKELTQAQDCQYDEKGNADPNAPASQKIYQRAEQILNQYLG